MKNYKVNWNQDKASLKLLIKDLSREELDFKKVEKLLRKYPKYGGGVFSKAYVLSAYKILKLKNSSFLKNYEEEIFLKNIKMKNVRTLSGVVPVAVLTKPFPCPGRCIFCPNDIKMPKSYLSSEPGALRALANKFDPYLQTFNRLVALKNIGHTVQKIELIVLGGTWSSYPKGYQTWFIKRCFDAMNDFTPHSNFIKVKNSPNIPLKELKKAKHPKNESYNLSVSKELITKSRENSSLEELKLSHKKNELAYARCVGLVLETRPDVLNKEEVLWLRRLGATKVQIGIQSTQDKVLKLNKRDHDLTRSKKALELLRLAGFKIHAHWMCNLYGSDPIKDKKDFKNLFSELSLRPDELKVYPCSLVEGTELVKYYSKGSWSPYTQLELLDVLKYVYKNTPRYCRISRMVRDIPSTDILVGNKKTNFRQIVESSLRKSSSKIAEIRSREIKNQIFSPKDIVLKKTIYKTSVSTEVFLEYCLQNDKLLGFLRLSLPDEKRFICEELEGSAIIREVHIYGQALSLKDSKGAVQHLGLGKKLIKHAESIAYSKGYSKLSVISSIGTKEYYRKQGFKDGDLYQYKEIKGH